MNLLDDKLFTVKTAATAKALSLPELLAALCAGEVISYPLQRPHQQPSWHAFLAQAAAMALARAGFGADGAAPSTADLAALTPDRWRAHLLALTPDFPDGDAFALLQDDPTRPAFMQPAVPADHVVDFQMIAEPAGIDVIFNGRNHAVKRGTLQADARAEHWIYALVAGQTAAAHGGRDIYGISRNAHGYASRAFVGLTPSLRASDHFVRDLRVLLAERSRFRDLYRFYKKQDGIAFLWTLPWDGVRQTGLDDLDPYFVEICRRVRLTRRGSDGFAALRGTSKAPRLNTGSKTQTIKGKIGDPWAPVDRAKGVVVNIAETTLSYEYLARLLFDREAFIPSLLQDVHAVDEEARDLFCVVRVVTCAPGQTGWAERILPVPRSARFVFRRASLVDGSGQGSDAASAAGSAGLIRDMLRDLDAGWRRALFPAAMEWLSAGGVSDNAGTLGLMTFEALRGAVETTFERLVFPSMWRRLADPEDGKAAFMVDLVDIFTQALETFMAANPVLGDFECAARAKAQLVLNNALKRDLTQDAVKERLAA